MGTFVVVLHWGDPAETRACLTSLREDGQGEVLVIDNGTPDRSGAPLAEAFPEFEHLRLEENLGFAGGCNVGMRRAFARGADYVLLLNNDATVRRGAVSALVQAAEVDPRVGMVNPKILYRSPPGRIWYGGGSFCPWQGLVRHLGRGEQDRGQRDVPGPVTFVTGCALLVRRRCVEEIGALDESLFMYAEDLDWCLRARAAGWTLWYEPRAVVEHDDPAQRWKAEPDAFRLRLVTRNTFRISWRHGRAWHRAAAVPYLVARWVGAQTLKSVLFGAPGNALAVWQGVGDAARHRRGPPG